MKTGVKAAVSALLVFGWVSATYAVPLIPGSAVLLPGTTEAARPELAGVVLADQLVSFSVTIPTDQHITGMIQERVVRESGSGTLDFYWRVFNDSSSLNNLGFFRLGQFITGACVPIDGGLSIDSRYTSEKLARVHQEIQACRAQLERLGVPPAVSPED